MNILFIDTEYTWRGGENQLLLLLDGLKEKNTQTHLVVPPSSAAYKRLSGSKLAKMYPINMKGASILIAIFKIAQYCRQNSIEIINTQTSHAHTIALAVKHLYPQVKLVVHRRVDYAPSKNIFSSYKYLSKKVDQYIGISNAISTILTQYGIEPHRVATVRSAVKEKSYESSDDSSAKIRLCQELHLDPKLPLIANVAYLTPQKGHETLLRGLGVLTERNINYNCIIAGDGPLRSKMERLAKELNISKNTHFLGIRNDPLFILQAADILAMPSNDEGLGTTILDALHADCCVVATRVGGIPEMIIHQETGLLSEKQDGKAHGDNLARVIEDQELARKLAVAGKQYVSKEFSVTKMVDGNFKIFQSLTKY